MATDQGLPATRTGGQAEAIRALPCASEELRCLVTCVARWPLCSRLFAIAVLALYIPVFAETARGWFEDAERYGHGIIVVAIALGLLYANRNAIRNARYAPVRAGFPLLAAGLLLQTTAWLTSIRFLAMASLVPVVAGAVLALHGREAWRGVGFPVCFLLFAATWPGFALAPISDWIQGLSALVAGWIVKALQIPIIQSGNIFILPNARLEVADVCSGFKKLVALTAIAVWYGHAYGLRPLPWLALIVASVPVALVANALRVSALIGIAYVGGEGAMEAAHDASEMFVLVIAYFMFVTVGKALGCRKLRSYA
jgi:exosortase